MAKIFYMNLRNWLGIVWGIMAWSMFVSCSGQEKEQQLTVLAWNVWHAGHSNAYGQQACDATIGIIKKSQADVVLMVETYGSAPMIADSLGFDYRLLSSNLCIFSRYPITREYTFPDEISPFNFGGVEIDMNGTPVRPAMPDISMSLQGL